MKTVDNKEVYFGDECYLLQKYNVMKGKIVPDGYGNVTFITASGNFAFTMDIEQTAEYICMNEKVKDLDKGRKNLYLLVLEEMKYRAESKNFSEIRIKISNLATELENLKQTIKNEISDIDRTSRFW